MGLTEGLTFILLPPVSILLVSFFSVAVGDSTFGYVVWAHRNFYAVSDTNSYRELSHLSAKVCGDNMTVGQLDPEIGSRQNFCDYAFSFDYIIS